VPQSDRPRAKPGSDGSELKPARIVVADDDRIARDLLAGILRGAGHMVEAVEDGQEAIEKVGGGGVDLVMLDLVMPRLGGLEACRLLKGLTSEGFLPVVLVTVRTDTASRVEGLRIGADDYVCKPFDEQELLARVAAMLRIKRLHDHVATQRARFERLSVHDEMTGLYNYRYLNTRITEEFKRAERYHEPFACVVIDVDQLRMINDAGGRALGDATIRFVADGIRRCVRDVDVVARYGGEEFLVVLPSTHFAGSVVVAERIWREVSGRPIDVDWEARRGEAPGSLEVTTRGTGVDVKTAKRDGGKDLDAAMRASSPDLGDARVPAPAKRETGRDLDVLMRASSPDLLMRASSPDLGRPDVVPAPPPPLQPPAPAPPAQPRVASPRPFTVSIGVALYPSRDVRTKDALLRAADSALSQAKREGGNRICVFQQQGYIYTPAIGAAAPDKRGRPGDEPGSVFRGAHGRPPTPSTAEAWRVDPDPNAGRKSS
jgi:two-component system, cell cycle response regulator